MGRQNLIKDKELRKRQSKNRITTAILKNNLKRKFAKEKMGITLIALVVTIVVMLILAGITLNMALGENGLLGGTSQSAKNQRRTVTKTKLEIIATNYVTNKTLDDSVTEEDLFDDIVKSDIVNGRDDITGSNGQYEVIDKEGDIYEIIIDEQGDVTVEFIGDKETLVRIRAIIKQSDTQTIVGTTITAEVTHNSNNTNIDITKCKWVYNNIETPIGTNEADYTGGTFSTNPQTINLTANTVGTYYLHVLTVDSSGNKVETVSNSFMIINQLATSILLSQTTANLKIGENVTITATVLPENTTNKGVTWNSSNPEVATVNNGVVSAVSVGETMITATTTDESKQTSEPCIITVQKTKVADLIGKPANNTKNTSVEDSNGNPVVIPPGFTVVPNGTDDVTYSYLGDGTPGVQDGIVIKDSDGNQFVWVPVGKIKNKVGDSRGSTSTITLGRYEDFTANNGVYTPKQVASVTEYDKAVSIKVTNHQELPSSNSTGVNKKAKDLEGFIRNTLVNGGYYIARYEASYRDGVKPYSIPSEGINYKTPKNIWTSLSQIAASAASQAMYDENSNFVSDLVNSYSWDTAIIFIQTYSDKSNYASQFSKNTTKANTGVRTDGTTDKVCNIYDMSSNLGELNTEYCGEGVERPAYAITFRGGNYRVLSYKAADRLNGRNISLPDGSVGFRPLLYCSSKF